MYHKTATNGSNDSKIYWFYSWTWAGGQMGSSNEQWLRRCCARGVAALIGSL